MGMGLIAVIALLGLGLAAGTAKAAKPPAPKPKPKPKPKSKVKIVKPPTKPKPKKKKPVAKTDLEKKIAKEIAKKEAIKKLKKKKQVDPKKVKKYFRSKPKKGYPFVWKQKKGSKYLWANKKGGETLRARGKHKFVKFDPKYATPRQKREFNAALAALAKPAKKPALPVQTGPNLAELAKYFRTKGVYGFPYLYASNATKAKVWANKPGADQIAAKGKHQFIMFDDSLATPTQKAEWREAIRRITPKDGPAPLPPAAKREVVKTIVKSEDTKPSPRQAAKMLQIYTKEGGWQGDRSKPSKVVRDCQALMGLSPADGIIGQGTRNKARELGHPLYARSYTKKGAYKEAETF